MNGQPLTTGFSKDYLSSSESSFVSNLWLIQMAIRGQASRINWQKVDAESIISGIRGVASGDGKPLSEGLELLKHGLQFSVGVALPGGSIPLVERQLTGRGDYSIELPPGTYILSFNSNWRARPAPPRG
ncbi:MAG TPA: hypothetical protein VF600_02855 [Abditibacteriaceae bacterium]